MNKTVLYTAITGGKDNLVEPSVEEPALDYVCFTDNPALTSEVWQIRLVKPQSNPTRSARRIKILAHEHLPEYEYSIWVDGQLGPKRELSTLLSHLSPDTHLALFAHEKRDCLYDEAEVCKALSLDDPETIDYQMAQYQDFCYPRQNGLVQSGVLVRRHNAPDLAFTMGAWWMDVDRYSHRDQLSFNFVAWSLGLRYCVIPGRMGEYFTRYRHNFSAREAQRRRSVTRLVSGDSVG